MDTSSSSAEPDQNSRTGPRSDSYLIRVTEPPTIACPAWCTVPKQRHLNELSNHGGSVSHIGDVTPLVPDGSCFAQLTLVTLTDGRPDPAEPELQVRIMTLRDGLYTYAEAKTLASRLDAVLDTPGLQGS